MPESATAKVDAYRGNQGNTVSTITLVLLSPPELLGPKFDMPRNGLTWRARLAALVR